jgi:hypothetical protein
VELAWEDQASRFAVSYAGKLAGRESELPPLMHIHVRTSEAGVLSFGAALL